MKKILLTICVISFSFAVFGQSLLSDFDGNQIGGIVITKWSPTITPEVVANPLKEGINTSNNVMSFAAHDFYAYYMNLPGFLIFQNVPAENFNNYTFVKFKYLVQDNTPESDTIKIQLKFEKGTEAQLYSTWLTIPVPAGHVNKWEEATMTIPRNPDTSPITHTQIDLMISSNLKTAIPFFVDDITFTNAFPTSLNSISPKTRLTIFQSGNSLNVKLDKAMIVKNLEIYSISGQLVKTSKLGYSTSEMTVPVDMANGCYILKVNSDEGTMNQKFIKY